jgi:hypothetical protein
MLLYLLHNELVLTHDELIKLHNGFYVRLHVQLLYILVLLKYKLKVYPIR